MDKNKESRNNIIEYLEMLEKDPSQANAKESFFIATWILRRFSPLLHKNMSEEDNQSVPDFIQPSNEERNQAFYIYELILNTFPEEDFNSYIYEFMRVTYCWINDTKFYPITFILLEFLYLKWPQTHIRENHDGTIKCLEAFLSYIHNFSDYGCNTEILTISNEDTDILAKSLIIQIIDYAVNSYVPSEVIEYLKVKLDEYRESRIIADIIVSRLHYFNQINVVIPHSSLYELVVEYSDCLSEDITEIIKLQPEIDGLEIMSAFEMHGNFSNLSCDNVKFTDFHFTIPYELMSDRFNNMMFLLEKDNSIYFKSVNKSDDYINNSTTIFGSIPIQYFSDLIGIGTMVVIRVPGFIDFTAFSCDVELDEWSRKRERERSTFGNHYNPYKHYLLELILDNHEFISAIVNLNGDKITNDTFSNILVNFMDKDKAVIAQNIVRFTKPESFKSGVVKYIEQFEILKTKERRSSIYQQLNNAKIETISIFNDYIVKFMKEVLEKQIRICGLSKFMFNESAEPKTEPELQPLIYSLLAPLESYGVQVQREEVKAGGKLDFTLRKSDYLKKIMSISCEMKLAHSKAIERGLLNQLPAYMDSCNSKKGIYLVLWFKSSMFKQPTSYNSPEELYLHLKSIAPKDIEVIVIDCNLFPSPSKIKQVSNNDAKVVL